ncbi:hypothetical protein ACFUOZ_00555 [Paenarthrobacter sp. NPDC057355]|uniref:VG15 protein n=1 Tax=Paenarthrobacter sp. NPDC057355 TaxID=3346105 RepID=UPI003630F20F
MLTASESKAALQLVVGAAVTAAVSLVGKVSGTPEQQRAVLLEATPEVIAYYSVGAAALAADFYDDAREVAGPPKLYVAEPIVVDRTEKVRRAIAWASEPLFGGEPSRAGDRLAEIIQLETARPYRDTIITNRRRDPSAVGWRRISRGGKSCKFCRMLADRGAVYSDKTARFAAHGHCGCTAQPVFSTDDFGEEASALQYLASKKRRTPAQQAQLREYLNTHYSANPKGVVVPAGKPKASSLTPDEKSSRLQAQLKSLEGSLAKLKSRAAAGEDVSTPLKWQENRIAELRRQLSK